MRKTVLILWGVGALFLISSIPLFVEGDIGAGVCGIVIAAVLFFIGLRKKAARPEPKKNRPRPRLRRRNRKRPPRLLLKQIQPHMLHPPPIRGLRKQKPPHPLRLPKQSPLLNFFP